MFQFENMGAFEDQLTALQWNEDSTSVIEHRRYQLQNPSDKYQLFCSNSHIYIVDLLGTALYRMHIP